MIKIAVFDLDGTLVNSLTDLALSVNKGLKAAGLEEHPVNRYKTFVGNGRELLVKRAMGDAAGDAEKFELVRSVFNDEYKLHCNDNTEAYEGCAEMLDILSEKGILTAVLSNKPDEFVDRILQKLYPDHTFSAAWGQKPEYKCKPDGESLQAQNGSVHMAGVSWGFRGKNELIMAGAPFVASTAEQLTEYIINYE